MKTEALQLSTSEWQSLPDYPFSSRIYYYSIVFDNGLFYIFGGSDNGRDQSQIGEFDLCIKTINLNLVTLDTSDGLWAKLGDLKTPRAGHGTVILDGEFLTAGGRNEAERAEFCNIMGSCEPRGDEIANFKFYPELLVVTSDFCSPN